jgi:hypothetical protein
MINKHTLKSILAGALISTFITGLFLATSFFGLSYLFKAFIYFGYPSLYIIEKIVPSSFVYWLFPEGGAPAGAFFILIASWSQLTIIMVAISHFYFNKKKKP